MMSRLVVSRCSLWCRTFRISRLFSITRILPNQERCYRPSHKGHRKLHRRVINETVLQEQMDMMKLAVADLESADRFGSLGIDCDVDEIKDLVERDPPLPSPTRKSTKSTQLAVSNKTDEHSQIQSAFSRRRLTAGVRQKEVKTPYQSCQQMSKQKHEHRISVPVDISNQTNEHVEIYNKLSGKNVHPNARPGGKNWSEKFGSLSDDVDKFLDKYVVDSESDDDCEKFTPLSTLNRKKHSPVWYGRRIAKFGRAGKVYEALETLEKQMLKEDRVPPNQYVFTVLVGVLGRVGYTEKAFSIFNKMKKYGLTPEDPTYTALFNACSNSPWPDDGLSRANQLRQLMAEEDYSPNIMTYNAMIKAYGQCGDMKSAFAAVDEALAAGHAPSATTYSCLLMACIADKSDGLKLAIEVWRLMRKKHRRPNTIHYNLLLRAIRDCAVGSEEHIRELLLPQNQSVSRKKVRFSRVLERKRPVSKKSLHVSSDSRLSFPKETKDPSEESQLSTVETDQHLSGTNITSAIPDLLDPRIAVDSRVELRLPESAADRLMMLGGMTGMLARMDRDKAKPDVKTFSMLLDMIPLTPEAETNLLSAMDFYDIQADVDFYNMLIRQRSFRRDFAGAHEIMSWLPQKNLLPNIQTFGCLAIGCHRKQDAVQLFHDIEVAGLVPNVEVCDVLLHRSGMNFAYKLYIMRTMKTHKIRPNANFIEQLEADVAHAQKMVVKMEKGEDVPDVFKQHTFYDGFQKLMRQYKSWLLTMELEPHVHPWAKFQQPVPSVERMLAAETDLDAENIN